MAVTSYAAPGLPTKRVGFASWFKAYTAMVKWEVVGARLFLPLLIIVQILAGAGVVLGFGLLIPDMHPAVALYLSTGAVVMSLILIGLIVTPQIVAQRRMEGSYDYLWSLPVPRTAAVLATMTLAGIVAVPGVVAALLVAVWRYDVSFAVHPTVVPAVVLTLACGTLIGTAVSHGLARPQLAMLLSQLFIFFANGFSPVFFPIERLPRWLATVHEYLPVYPMARSVRASLTDGLATMPLRYWLVLVAWTLLGGGVTGLVLVRRK